MSIDLCCSGDCSNCGKRNYFWIYDVSRGRYFLSGLSLLLLSCSQCLQVEAVEVKNDEITNFLSKLPPCPTCNSKRQKWNYSKCLHCGQDEVVVCIEVPD
jgi:hypothetical protein